MNSKESFADTGSVSEDDKWSILREHNATGGKTMNPVDTYTAPLVHRSAEEIARNEHGGVGTYINPVDAYTAPLVHRSVEEIARNEHGGGAGVPEDTNERYGTNDREVLNTMNQLRYANWAADLDQKISILPEKSLSELIALRFKNTANTLDDRGADKKSLSENMCFDLAIIAQTVRLGKEIPEMNVSQYVGQKDERNVSGVLDAYQEKINETGRGEIELLDAHSEKPILNPETNKPYTASEAIASIKQELSNQTEVE